MGLHRAELLINRGSGPPTYTSITPDNTPSGAVWTITRQAGRVKHERVINEAFLQPGELAVLKGLVRA